MAAAYNPQATHVGRTVNGLRKSGGQVGEIAKKLVKKWKKILPSNGHSTHQHSSKVAQQPAPTDAHRSEATSARLQSEANQSRRMDHPHVPTPPSKQNDRSKHDRGRADVKRMKVTDELAVHSTSTAGFQSQFLDLPSAGVRTSHKDASDRTSRKSASTSKSKERLDVPGRDVRSSHSVSPTPFAQMSGSGARNLSPPENLLLSSSPTLSGSPSKPSDLPSARKRKGQKSSQGKEGGKLRKVGGREGGRGHWVM